VNSILQATLSANDTTYHSQHIYKWEFCILLEVCISEPYRDVSVSDVYLDIDTAPRWSTGAS